MNLSAMISAVREHSGQSSDAVIRSAIQLAAEELWNTVDLPGSLRELRACTNSERYVTLPWEVYKVRKVRMSNARMDMEINTIVSQYNDGRYFQSDIVCRMLRRVPLHTKISNASTLRFKLKRAEETDVTFVVRGSTDLASRVIEPVTITAGNLYQDTVERYFDIPDSITKNRTTLADVLVYDANNVELALFPSHLTACEYHLCQMYDRCVYITSPYVGCFDIIYKPHMPPLVDDNDDFPAPFHQVVIFKALEQIYLKSDETADVAATYSTKASNLLAQFTEDENTGKTMRPAVKSNRFVTAHPGKL